MIRGMTPQMFPLVCAPQGEFGYRVVIGWTGAGLPVVVRHTSIGLDGKPSQPEVLKGPVCYALPEHDVSIGQEVTLSSSSQITVAHEG